MLSRRTAVRARLPLRLHGLEQVAGAGDGLLRLLRRRLQQRPQVCRTRHTELPSGALGSGCCTTSTQVQAAEGASARVAVTTGIEKNTAYRVQEPGQRGSERACMTPLSGQQCLACLPSLASRGGHVRVDTSPALEHELTLVQQGAASRHDDAARAPRQAAHDSLQRRQRAVLCRHSGGRVPGRRSREVAQQTPPCAREVEPAAGQGMLHGIRYVVSYVSDYACGLCAHLSHATGLCREAGLPSIHGCTELRPAPCSAPSNVGDEQGQLRRDARRWVCKQQLQRQRTHSGSLLVRQARVLARGHRFAPAAPHSVLGDHRGQQADSLHFARQARWQGDSLAANASCAPHQGTAYLCG